MNQSIKQSLDFYFKITTQTLKNSEHFAEISSLATSINCSIDISIGEAMDAKKDKYPKKIYLSFSILDNQRKIVCVDPIDFEHLTDATIILEIDRKNKVQFFTWQEDKDFIESLEWIIEELKALQCE